MIVSGKNYAVDKELSDLKDSIQEAKASKGSFKDLKLPHNLKPLIISLSLMVFQQVSGINAILFNLTIIFKVSRYLTLFLACIFHDSVILLLSRERYYDGGFDVR